jgi:septal ring factor EnvC (AmiA/AmiB activator)
MKKKTKTINVSGEAAAVIRGLNAQIQKLKTEISSLEHSVELLEMSNDAKDEIIATYRADLESLRKWSNLSAAISQMDLNSLTRPRDQG